MNSKKQIVEIKEFDVEELVRGMYDLSDDIDPWDVVEREFGVSWETFMEITAKLFGHIVVGRSPLSGKIYKGFGKHGVFFIKAEVME